MENNRPPTLMGYDLVISRVKARHLKETGHEYGALAALAEQLGVSRNTLDNWSRRAGFPPQYVAKVSEITGLPQKVIRPKTSLVEMPTEDLGLEPQAGRWIVHPMGKKYG